MADASRRKRGGVWQRNERDTRARIDQEPDPHSQLAYFLVTETLWGAISPQFAKKVASLAAQDCEAANTARRGFRFRELDVLATLPSSHLYQRLVKKLSVPHIPMTVIRLSMKCFNVIDMFDTLILWPHEFFAALYHKYPREWAARILPDVTRIRIFWDAIADHPLLQGHPIHGIRGWRDRCIPISVHGDGVPVTGIGKSWSKSMEVLSWASCLAQGTTLGTFNFIFAMFKTVFCTEPDRDTVRELCEKLRWSFEALYAGEWPYENWLREPWPRGSVGYERQGTPLCGSGRLKFFCFPIIYRGDLEWKRDFLGLQNYNLANEPCNSCRANSSTRNWRNFNRDSPAMATTWTTEAWRHAKHPPKNPLFLSAFMSILVVLPDWMHTMHLGVYQYMLSSVLWLLVFDVLGGTPQENMKRVWTALRTFWRLYPTPGRFQNMRIPMFEGTNSSYPYLKGQAAEIKRLVPALLEVWENLSGVPREHPRFIIHKQIALMLKKFKRMDEILDQHPPVDYPKLPEAAARNFQNDCFDVLQVIQYVHGYFITNFVLIPNTNPAVAKPLFNITFKCHSIMHIAKASEFLNPRLAICYAGEDYMKHIKN